jgi:hypothetical protein
MAGMSACCSRDAASVANVLVSFAQGVLLKREVVPKEEGGHSGLLPLFWALLLQSATMPGDIDFWLMLSS